MADPYTPYAAAPAMTYASWIQRVGGGLIDLAPPVIVLIILAQLNTAAYVVGWVLVLGWTTYNRWYLGGTTGQSVGRKALRLRLVSEESGQPIGLPMAFGRDICHLVDSICCYVGFLFPLWDAKRQTLADMITKTVVIPV